MVSNIDTMLWLRILTSGAVGCWRRPRREALGGGGIRLVSEITGVARSTIGRGLSELGGETAPSEPGRVRRPGGGRNASRRRRSNRNC